MEIADVENAWTAPKLGSSLARPHCSMTISLLQSSLQELPLLPPTPREEQLHLSSTGGDPKLQFQFLLSACHFHTFTKSNVLSQGPLVSIKDYQEAGEYGDNEGGHLSSLTELVLWADDCHL